MKFIFFSFIFNPPLGKGLSQQSLAKPVGHRGDFASFSSHPELDSVSRLLSFVFVFNTF